MLLINNITNDAAQQSTLTGIPGLQIGMLLRYMPRIQRWIFNINYNNFTVNGLAVVASPNILRQWKNIIPFGIACTCAGGLDPFRIDDFSNGVANLYLLNSDDIAAVETEFFT